MNRSLHWIARLGLALAMALSALAATAADTPEQRWQAYNQANERKDTAQARTILEELAATGFDKAVAEQANAYRQGTLYGKDLRRAYELFEQAAAAGNSWAMRMLGWMCQEGEGRAQDPVAAHAWFAKAAEKGDPWSWTQLGWNHDNGLGTPKDGVEAVRWYTKAAEANQPVAMNNLGVIYRDGRPGVPPDAEKARLWTEKAAAAGNESAKRRLAEARPATTPFVPRPLPVDPEMATLFRGALLAAAEMGFKADNIDNDGRSAELRRDYRGTEVVFHLSVPRSRTVRGNFLVRNDDVREGFIRLYRQELAKKVGTSISLMGNINGD